MTVRPVRFAPRLEATAAAGPPALPDYSEPVLVALHAVDPARVGLPAARTLVREITPRPPRQAGEQVKDDGTSGVVLADFLTAQKFI